MKSSATIRLVEVTETVPPKKYFSWYGNEKHIVEEGLTTEETILVFRVFAFYGLDPEKIISDSGVYPLTEARQMCYMLLTDIYGTRNKDIAVFFKKNHGTVISGIKRINGLVQFDKKVKSNYEEILKLI